MGGNIGDVAPQTQWLGKKVKALQQGWDFVQHDTQGPGKEFWSAEKSLREDFLPTLSFGVAEQFTDRTIILLTVKDRGMSSTGNWTASSLVTRHLAATLQVHVKLFSRDHVQLLINCKAEI